jgi:phosphomannomutase
VGGEESFGYMVGDAVRDKDAVAATLLLLWVALRLKPMELTVYKELIKLYVDNGFTKNI